MRTLDPVKIARVNAALALGHAAMRARLPSAIAGPAMTTRTDDVQAREGWGVGKLTAAQVTELVAGLKDAADHVGNARRPSPVARPQQQHRQQPTASRTMATATASIWTAYRSAQAAAAADAATTTPKPIASNRSGMTKLSAEFWAQRREGVAA